MAKNPGCRIALLSVKPKFALSLINGDKKVEFRKQRFHKDVSHVVVYATSPVKKILGYFEVSHVDEDSPDKLWTRYKAIGGISFDDFQDYYSSSVRGVAIGVSKVCALKTPMPLSQINDSLSAPQSFAYLVPKDFEKVRACNK